MRNDIAVHACGDMLQAVQPLSSRPSTSASPRSWRSFIVAFATHPKARAQDNGHHLHHADHYSKWKQPGTAASCCNGRETKDGQTTGDCDPTTAEVRPGSWWAKRHDGQMGDRPRRPHPARAQPGRRTSPSLFHLRPCAVFRSTEHGHLAIARPSPLRESSEFTFRGDCDASLAAARTLRRSPPAASTFEMPGMRAPLSFWPRCHVSHALSRDGHRRSKARPRVLLLDHLFAPVGAPGNVGAHAMSAERSQTRPGANERYDWKTELRSLPEDPGSDRRRPLTA